MCQCEHKNVFLQPNLFQFLSFFFLTANYCIIVWGFPVLLCGKGIRQNVLNTHLHKLLPLFAQHFVTYSNDFFFNCIIWHSYGHHPGGTFPPAWCSSSATIQHMNSVSVEYFWIRKHVCVQIHPWIHSFSACLVPSTKSPVIRPRHALLLHLPRLLSKGELFWTSADVSESYLHPL